jgi:hypothetical protein
MKTIAEQSMYLNHLGENVRLKRPEHWSNHNWLLYQYNVLGYTFLKTTEFVANNNTVIIPHLLYSPDLPLCDFALFPKLKIKLKGQHIEEVSDIQRVL